MEDEGLKKYIVGIALLVLIVVILLIIYFVSKNNKPDEIEVVLKSNGFKLEDGIYVKQKSELSRDTYFSRVAKEIDAYNEMLYFDVKKYQLKEISLDYYEGMITKRTAIFDYKKDLLTYTNDISYKSNNYVFKGQYEESDNIFECELTKSKGPSIEDSEKDFICSNIEISLDRFYTEVDELFEDTKIREKIRG